MTVSIWARESSALYELYVAINGKAAPAPPVTAASGSDSRRLRSVRLTAELLGEASMLCGVEHPQLQEQSRRGGSAPMYLASATFAKSRSTAPKTQT